MTISARSMKRSMSRWIGPLMLGALIPVLAMDAHSRSASHAGARRASRTVWDSVYSQSQASRGETAYAKTCARCHGASLSGGDESPALTGGNFLGNWNGLPLSDLQTRIQKTMPSDSVGIYDRQLVTDVMAFMLKANGFPAGQTDLPKEIEPLKEIMIRAGKPDPGSNVARDPARASVTASPR
jgi:S-disulfanyl-L-cysteine oxidoreductase SoxD